MNYRWAGLLCVLSLSLAAAPLRAQQSSDGAEKCSGGGDGVKCGAHDLVFPFKEELHKKKAASELNCVGGKEKDGKIAYAKCKHKTFKDFDEVAIKIKIAGKEKMKTFDKEKLKRAQQLAALHSAKKSLKAQLKELSGKDSKDDNVKQAYKKLSGADDKIKDDLKKAVSKCKDKDSADMDCDAKFPDED